MPWHLSLTVIGDTCGYQFPLSSSLLPLFCSIDAIWFMNEGCFDTSRYILANWFNNLLLKSKIHQGRICLLLEELSLRICLFIISISALGVVRTDPCFLFVKVVCESFQPKTSFKASCDIWEIKQMSKFARWPTQYNPDGEAFAFGEVQNELRLDCQTP